MNSVAHDCALGLLLGTAVGDAFGIPYECKSYHEIKKMRENSQNNSDDDATVNPFIKCTDHPFIPENFKPGEFTDDTQLTLAMARALYRFTSEMKNSNYETTDLSKQDIFLRTFMPLVVEEHVLEFKKSIVGWGGTRNAIQRLSEGTHDFKTSGNVGAKGNGVLMKLAPLYFYYFHRVLQLTPGMNSEDGIRIIEKASEEWMDQQLHTITIMTHNTESCMITTCILVRFGLLVQLFGDQFVHHKMEIINNLIGYCKELEKKVLSNNEEHEISCRLQLLKENLEHLQDDTTLIQVSNEGTYESVNSLIMVIGVILSLNVSESKPFKLVLRAGTIGGDCDSNAAMVGALIGTVFGKSVLPHSFITHLIDRDKLMEEAAQFAEALEKTR